MDIEEKPQVPQEWQETATEEPQQVVCEEPQETPSEEPSEETSEDIEQNKPLFGGESDEQSDSLHS